MYLNHFCLGVLAASGSGIAYVVPGTLSLRSSTPLINGYADFCISSDGTSAYSVDSATSFVYQFSRSVATGALSAMTPASVAAGVTPNMVCISTDGKSVYVANMGSAFISQYTRNITTGALSPMTPATLAVPAAWWWIRITTDGKNLYGGSYNGGVSILSRNVTTGLLTYVSKMPAQSRYYGSMISPDDTSVYSAGNGTIITHTRNTTTGALTFQNEVNVSSGVSPNFYAVSPDGKFLYVRGSPNNVGLQIFSRNTTSGILTFINTVNPLGYGGGSSVSPDGKYLASIVGGAGATVMMYTLNSVTGAPTNIPSIISAACSFTVFSPDSKFMYTAQGTNMVAYSIAV
jgi:sugar lactone lactonase YvrE